MLSDADRNKAADILVEAEGRANRRCSSPPLGPASPSRTPMASRPSGHKRRMAAGAKLIGHKVGLTSKAMQRSSNIDEPDFGYLYDDMMVPDGAKVAARQLLPASRRGRACLRARQAADGTGRRPDRRAGGDRIRGAGAGDRRRAGAGPAQDFRHRVRQRRRRRHRHRRPAGAADGCRPALGRRHHVRELRDRGDRRRRRRARPPGDGRGLARQQARQRWARPMEPGHIVLAGSFTRVVFPPRKATPLHGDFGQLGGISVQFV